MKALVVFQGVEMLVNLADCTLAVMQWYQLRDKNFRVIRYVKDGK